MQLINNDIIFNTIDNGIIILDENLNIKAWNRWLEIKTGIKSDDIIGKDIDDEFSYINVERLKRKIKTVLIMKNPSYFSVDPHEYLIKIESNVIIGKIFKHMRQDITIVPYDVNNGLVCLYIYDHTQLHASQEKLKSLNEELRDLSTRDPLTHLFNRRYFSETSKSLYNLAIRNNQSICVILLDIDNFKSINDEYGHLIGDKVIINLAKILDNNSRKSDVLARFGGEEFILLLYNTDINFAELIAEHIRRNVEEYRLNYSANKSLEYTVSLGVAQFNPNEDSNLEVTINRADKALYKAKTSGKNRVEVLL